MQCPGRFSNRGRAGQGRAFVMAAEDNEWFWLDSGPCEPAFNMALDEALLEAAPRLGRPVLRFYGWTAPAATFGYFQRYAEVARATGLRPLLRRPTGGGLVPHAADWTYSLTCPATHPWHGLRAPASYRRMHEWMRAAFARLGLETELASHSHHPRPGECFAGHELDDVLWQGRKVAGAAQRRTRTALLIQGSVQPPPGPTRRQWQEALCAAATDLFGAYWTVLPTDAALGARAEELARDKYRQADHHQRR